VAAWSGDRHQGHDRDRDGCCAGTGKGAGFENGLLVVDLVREIPEAMKRHRIEINGAAPSKVTQIEAKAA
jgi:hypothetical protein